MKWCSLCCCSLPEDSSKHRRLTQHLIESGPLDKERKTARAYHRVLCSPSSSPCSLVVYCVNKLRRHNISLHCVPVYCHINASHVNHDRAFLWSIIQRTHDISHPIVSMQIPLENKNTVQELPDTSFCMLMMQYIQHCGKGRGLGSRRASLSGSY